jgi:SAM-dependent methyltransferase
MINKNSFDGSLLTKGSFFRKSGLDTVEEEIAESVQKFLDTSKQSIGNEFVRDRGCEVCLSKKRRIIFYKFHFPHVKCLECGFVYVAPVLKNEILKKHYIESSNKWTDVTIGDDFRELQKKYNNFHLDNIEQVIGTENRSILDIGCNAGEFLCDARERGWETMGLELNTYAVEEARRKGLDVHNKEFNSEFFEGKKFGAITFFGVLEHLPEPYIMLKSIRKICETGSVVASLVPNIDSLVARTLHEKSNTFDGIEHINFWNRVTFSRFMSRAGYEVRHCETTISEIYTIDNYLNYNDPYSDFEKDISVLDTITPEFIHRNFLGHHLCSYSRFLPD